MKEEEKNKKFNKKWLIAVVLIAVVVIALVIYSGIFSIPTGMATVNTQQAEIKNNQPPTYTVTGNEYLSKEVNVDLPYEEPIDMEVGRYDLQVQTDKPVWIMFLPEYSYNDWKSGVRGGLYVKSGTGCCSEKLKTIDYTNRFDINKGNLDIVKYYLVIDGSEKTSIKFKLTQILKFV